MKKILGSHFKWFFLFFVFGAGLTYALGYYIQFHVVGNDFWNILYYGRNMNVGEPASLYNGFYPFGYAFLIGQMPFTYVLRLSYLLNALLTGLFTASVSTLILSTRSIPATILAFFSSIAAPFVFFNAHSLGPDIGSAAFTAFAVFLLWHDHFSEIQDNLPGLRPILIGASLGMAFLFRTHAVVSAVAIILGYFLLMGFRPVRSRLLMVGAFLFFALIQVIVNLVSGHGAFETAQAFNVYKFFYGVNWAGSPTPQEIERFSILEAFLENPARAMGLYFSTFRVFISYAWASVAFFLLAPKGRFSRYALFSSIFVILYAIPISLGDSARAPVILMSLYVPSLAMLLVILTDQVKSWLNSSRWVAIVVAILFMLAGFQNFRSWILQDIWFIRTNHEEHRIFTMIEYILRANGMKSSVEVFSDRFDFYMPNTMPYLARQVDNYSGDWFWGFSEEFPPLPKDSLESFFRACKEQGIRFLVLSPNSHYRGEIFPQIYHGEVDLEGLGLQFLGQRGNLRTYMLIK
jgi:hypothetical protein